MNMSATPLSSGVCRDIPVRYAPAVQLGTRIRRLRDEQALTQEELASRANVRQGEISKWESGKQEPTVQSLLRLAVGLGRPLDTFVMGLDADYDRLANTRSGGKGAADVPASARVLELTHRTDKYKEAVAKIADQARQLLATALTVDESGATSRNKTGGRGRDRKAG